jgi:predicted nucleotidyltransferase
MPSTVLKESDIDMAVREAVKELTPDVQWIRHEIALDWSGDRAIFFRVVLSNDASREARLRKVTRRVESVLTEKLNLDESDLLSYFNYRNRSEQAAAREPAWSKR